MSEYINTQQLDGIISESVGLTQKKSPTLDEKTGGHRGTVVTFPDSLQSGLGIVVQSSVLHSRKPTIRGNKGSVSSLPRRQRRYVSSSTTNTALLDGKCVSALDLKQGRYSYRRKKSTVSGSCDRCSKLPEEKCTEIIVSSLLPSIDNKGSGSKQPGISVSTSSLPSTNAAGAILNVKYEHCDHNTAPPTDWLMTYNVTDGSVPEIRPSDSGNDRSIPEAAPAKVSSAGVQSDLPVLITASRFHQVPSAHDLKQPSPQRVNKDDYGSLKPLSCDFRYAYPNLWHACNRSPRDAAPPVDFQCTKYRISNDFIQTFRCVLNNSVERCKERESNPLNLKVFPDFLQSDATVLAHLPSHDTDALAFNCGNEGYPDISDVISIRQKHRQTVRIASDLSDGEQKSSLAKDTICLMGGDSAGEKTSQSLISKVASTTLSPTKGATSDGDIDGFWKRSGGISDTDSNPDVQSDLCESIESLLGAVSDLDLPGSSVHSEISDEAVEIGVNGKLLGKEESSRPISPTPEEVYTTPADEFVTSPSAYSTGSVTTHDYYPVAEEKPIGNVGVVYSWLRFSLFPCVPPTINFRVSDSAPLNIPPEIKKVLKWKSTTVTPVIVRRVLFNSGMRIVKRSRQWIGIWAKHMRAGVFKTLKDFQKFNHFPGTFQIGRKDTLWRNHYRLRSLHGRRCYDFVPTTYVIPADMKQLRQAWDKGSPQQMWIVKPPASARGSGIKVVHKFVQIPKIRPLVIQKYLAAPFLINGVKFDLRIYVYVTSFYPLRIYVYKEGLVRFASVTYSPCTRTVGDRYMHLTNYSVNRKSLTYTANEDMDACKGHKWSLKALWGYLAEQGHNTTAIWNAIVEIIIKTVISCETTVSTLTRLNLRNPFSCHELFGFDIILDNKLKPWLLEVNISPSLQSSSKLDVNIKGHMCKDLLNLAGIMIPPHLEKSFQASFSEKLGKDAGIAVDNLCFDKRLFRTMLSLEERAKQVAYAHMDRHEYLSTILDNLVPDDVRQLVLMEDERCRSGQYIRVFPTHTTYRYLKFFERPRYYNHLFDAWETRYHSAREEGIQRLVASCHQGMHLTVVPKESLKASSPKADLGRLSNSSSHSSLRVRCCGRSATHRAFRRACRSARNLLARMRMPRPHLLLNSPPSLEGRIKSPPINSNSDTKSLGTPSTQTSCSRPLVALNRIQLIHRDDGLNTTPGNTWQSHEFIAKFDSNVAKENAELKPSATTQSCGELGLHTLSEKQRHVMRNGVMLQKQTSSPPCNHRDTQLCSYHFRNK